MIQRQRFAFNISAAATDTGPGFTGRVHQLRWQAISGGDTGDDLAIYLQQTPGDTGDGIPILTRAGSLASDFVLMPRRPVHNVSGAVVDTGDDFSEPVISAGEHLRVRVSPGGASVDGTLYVWTES